MSREQSINAALTYFDEGYFVDKLKERIAIKTESQEPAHASELHRYLAENIVPDVERLGFSTHIVPDPTGKGGPYLIARRIEDPKLPTLLTYGHGDVVLGMDSQWSGGRSPWELDIEGDKIFGRGVVDNKGQFTLNLIALEAVLKTRGSLGYNVTILLETSEEVGSPGIRQVVAAHKQELSAGVFIASDGPRLRADRPTLYLGCRGAISFDLRIRYREGGHHSGNWGGLLANPGVRLANAIAELVDGKGRVRLKDVVPDAIPEPIRRALADCPVDPGPEGPQIDDWWGDERLSRAEKLFAWNSFDVLAFSTGAPDNPVNAVPHEAFARCHIRYTVDKERETFIPAIRAYLSLRGYDDVAVTEIDNTVDWGASRMDPASPWPRFIADSIDRTLDAKPVVVPNFGGSCANDSFADTLGLATIYIPHSYPGCSQHAPNEHGLLPLFREGMAMMAGLFDDLGRKAWPVGRS